MNTRWKVTQVSMGAGTLSRAEGADDSPAKPSPNRHQRRAQAAQKRKQHKREVSWAEKGLSAPCRRFVQLTIELMQARAVAGGKLSQEDESERVAALATEWQQMTEKERVVVDAMFSTGGAP